MFIQTLKYIHDHPLNKGHFGSALRRYLSWQIGSRLAPGPVAVPFVNKSMLMVHPGMTGATQNIYCGLHEFADTSFLLHLLRPGDLFVDVGANVGVYTILASAAIGAKSICFEPNPSTFDWLARNIRLNDLAGLVESHNACAGKSEGVVGFDVSGQDTTNHVCESGSTSTQVINVPVIALDQCVGVKQPILIKIDVEGFESTVLAGADRVLSDPGLLALTVELSDDCLRYGFGIDEAHNAIMSHGFRPASYDPFTRRLRAIDGRNRESANTIYLRDLQATQLRVSEAPPFVVNGRKI